jgi:hypothetical protein
MSTVIHTKLKPMLLASTSKPSYHEPPVKKSRLDLEEKTTEEKTTEEKTTEEKTADQENPLKPFTVFTVPAAQELQQSCHEDLKQEKKEFIQELVCNFRRNVRRGRHSFVVCYDIQYEWEYRCLEKLFRPKGYDVVYKNVLNAEEDRTFAELRIPGCVDTQEPFRL